MGYIKTTTKNQSFGIWRIQNINSKLFKTNSINPYDRLSSITIESNIIKTDHLLRWCFSMVALKRIRVPSQLTDWDQFDIKAIIESFGSFLPPSTNIDYLWSSKAVRNANTAHAISILNLICIVSITVFSPCCNFSLSLPLPPT